MNWIVKKVKPQSEYKLQLTFADNQIKVFDMKPFLEGEMYEPLLNIEMFNTAKVSFGTVEWANGADIDPESLYYLAT